jgi:hypothetical protein
MVNAVRVRVVKMQTGLIVAPGLSVYSLSCQSRRTGARSDYRAQLARDGITLSYRRGQGERAPSSR